MNVLITGVAGFIGSNLAKSLLSRPAINVIGIDNLDDFYSIDLKKKNLSSLVKHPNFTFYQLDLKKKEISESIKENFEIVIHLASRAGVLPSIKNPSMYIENNISATLNLLEFMRQKGCSKMIFASSSSIYGNNKNAPSNEEDLVNNPISPYAFTKKSCELLNHTYHHLYKFDILNLRFFTVYGPGQRPDLAIRKFIENIKADLPIEMYGDGNSARDYTYVDDTVQGIEKAIDYLTQHENVFETINIGNSNPITLKKLIQTIYSVLDKPQNIIQKPSQPGDVNVTFADITKANKLLGYSPKTSIEEGLKKFIEWQKKEYSGE